LYNLQLFTQILEQQGMDVPRQRASSFPPGQTGVKASALKVAVRNMRDALERVIDRRLEKNRRVFLCGLYGSRIAKWRLILASRFSIIPTNPPPAVSDRGPMFDSRRNNLSDLPAFTPFEKILVGTLKHQLPPIFLEGYSDL